MQNKKLSTLIKISVLAAMAFILMYIEFPIPPFPDYLKFDISDLPALVGGLALGPIAGVVVELVKNLLHFALATKSGGIGELANFITGCALIIPAATLYKINKSRKKAVLGLIIGVIAMAIVMGLANYYVLLPLYGWNDKKVNYATVTSFIIPFNLLKGTILSIITFLSYKRLSPILHK